MVNTYLYLGTQPSLYEHLGRILHFPMLQIAPIPLSEDDVLGLIQDIHLADAVLLTSRYAVEHLYRLLDQQNVTHVVQDKTVGVIGFHTSEAYQHYFNQTPTITAKKETSEGLFDAMLDSMNNMNGKQIVFPRSALPNPVLKEKLTELGARVVEIPVYQNIKTATKALPPQDDIDGIIFTSPSTVDYFLTDHQTIPQGWRIVAKGPRTLKTLDQHGYQGTVIDEIS